MSTVLVSTYAGEQFIRYHLGDTRGAAMTLTRSIRWTWTPPCCRRSGRAPARGLDTLELGASGNVTFTAEDARPSVGVAETAAAGGGGWTGSTWSSLTAASA
jgi:hypothetical protein